MPKKKRAKSPNLDLLDDGFDDDLSSNDDKPGTPIQRNAANARERARMRVLSKAFFNLKRNIPWVPVDTKLSKLDTLRLAKNYINYLAATLDGQSVEDFSTNLAQPPKTAWPFIFQPVQAHEPAKSKLVSVATSNSEKWPSRSCNSATTPAESSIKSQQRFTPSKTAATTSAGGSFSMEENIVESRSLGLNHPHHHLHQGHTIIHHMQQQQHHHHPHLVAPGVDTVSHLSSYSHSHILAAAMSND
ncbi:basic helix-loop-helix transcription factor scleraxis [Topomyia yanbarensis]|uniref:basic helix-loop-helix transcription factor scleraxis n=1 Tax=Topomyia yanbarensis TaxID=2498891 RepID=UPI00273B7073|nr:basic helix-loop-helix transcription factor scleraxis [Topomyia yanbarensis]